MSDQKNEVKISRLFVQSTHLHNFYITVCKHYLFDQVKYSKEPGLRSKIDKEISWILRKFAVFEAARRTQFYTTQLSRISISSN